MISCKEILTQGRGKDVSKLCYLLNLQNYFKSKLIKNMEEAGGAEIVGILLIWQCIR